MKYLILTLIISLNFLTSFSQKKLLDNPYILANAKVVLDASYNIDFEKARESLENIKSCCPDHPVVNFLEAFIIYWEYFPLYPEHEKADQFIYLMEDCIKTSEKWLKDDGEMEAVFFDMFGRAFFMMFWADNGKSGKVLPHINQVYKHTVKGFDLMYEFNEFYFTTGLYNYYIEAYPQKHPAYKPIVSLFKNGNKDLGLEQLRHCADSSTFLRIEAKLFLSLIYMNYENKMDSASIYAAQLYNEFPENPYYAGRYLELLILNKKFFFVPIILKHLYDAKGDYAKMQYELFTAIYLEKKEKKYDEAFAMYQKAYISNSLFGPLSEKYSAIANMGMGRIQERKGNYSKAKKYFREAKEFTSYDYVLEDR